MPTHESSEAFAKLVQTRDRLNEITRRLNEAESSEPGVDKLKIQWDQAFREFESATKGFYAAVRKLRKKIDARQSGKDLN